MRSGAATGDAALDAELRRLREDLYRPSPPPGTVERYTALLERTRVEQPVETVVAKIEPGATTRRRRLPLVLAGAVVAAALGTAAFLPRPTEDPSQAVPLVTGGPYAVADRDALGSLLDPARTDADLVVRAVTGSELPQLDVWDVRPAAVWLQQGTGPLSRRFEGWRPAATSARPFSVVVQCDRAARYRWTIIGTTPARPAVHVLETASSATCGRTPTVATFTRPAGAVVRGFDLAVGAEVRWGMAFVRPADQGY